MKRNILIAILWIFFPFLFCAQALLQSGDLHCDIGWEYVLHRTDYKVTPASKNQSLWDFSGLSIQTSNVVSVIDASTSPFASDYPDATHCHSLGQGGYLYSQRSDDHIILQGGVAGVTKVLSVDHKTVLSLPIKLGDSQQDVFKNQLTVQGVDIVREGTVTVLCVGTGDLILPFGTIQGVVLLQSIEEYIDSYDILGRPAQLTSQVVDQVFYHPKIGEAVLRFSQKSIDNSSVTRYGTLLDEEAVKSIVEISAPLRDLELKTLLDNSRALHFISEWSGPATVVLLNKEGLHLMSLYSGPVEAGTFSIPVNLSSMDSGEHYIRVEMDGRKSFHKVDL